MAVCKLVNMMNRWFVYGFKSLSPYNDFLFPFLIGVLPSQAILFIEDTFIELNFFVPPDLVLGLLIGVSQILLVLDLGPDNC